MRELKCRAKVKWNGNHFFAGDWVEGFYAYKELTDEHVILVERANMNRPGSYFAEAEVIHGTVGQYTGLKDKNGKEIYEGDIAFHRDYECCGYVVFSGDELAFAFLVITGSNNKGLTTEFEWLYDYADGLEIIGNIHDNPELLEAQHE